MTDPLLDLIYATIHERGPITVAAFMELALYHPEFGYYARAPRTSGSASDSVTSVDVCPLFGELLAEQLREMAALLGPPGSPFTLVEAGAGDGRLSHAMLRGLKKVAPHVCSHTHLHLVERSAAARQAQHSVLAAWTEQAIGSDALPDKFEGVIVANELLGALPVHRVVTRGGRLREVYVGVEGDGLAEVEGPVSSPSVSEQLAAAGTTPAEGSFVDVPTGAANWVRDAANCLTRGFMLLIDEGHEASHLQANSSGNPAGTQRSTRRRSSSLTSWLKDPGEQELAATVDFTGVRAAAESAGCATLGLMDQTHFLLALAGPRVANFDDVEGQAFRKLVLPGGLGGTTKVLVLAKNVPSPALRCCSGHSRPT